MSIKNKFATAVATASLLAGLFGSAFVPSAMAGITGAEDVVVPKYTTLDNGSAIKRTTTTSKVFGFQVADRGGINTWISMNLFEAGAAGAGTLGYDFHAASNTDVQLKAVSSNPNILVGWAYDGADATDPAAMDCDNTAVLVGASSTATDIDDLNSNIDVTAPTYTDPATYKLCLDTKTATTAATSTITVTVGGVVATTFTVTAVGPVASLTAAIANGYKYIAEGNDFQGAWFTIIAKDANGTQINGPDNSVSQESVDVYAWEDNPLNKQDLMVDPFGGSSNSGDYSYFEGDGSSYIYYDLESDTCLEETGTGEGDGDAGSTYSIKFADEATDADVVSNAVSITCTLNSDGARVTALTPEALTGARDYNEPNSGTDWFKKDDLLGLVATVVDADGRPLGDGADFVDFDWEVTSGDTLLDATIGYAYFGDGDDRKVIGGDYVAATLNPLVSRDGRFTYVITALDSDLGALVDVEKAFTNRYTVGQSDGVLTRTRNAAKTVAVFRADFGEDAAFDIVTFFVELASGRVVEYDRPSNADGVATLTLRKRNTKIYVFADYLGASNQVAARFR